MIALLNDVRTLETLDPRFVAKVLSCYFDHTTYLKQVTVTSQARQRRGSEQGKDVSALGTFRIDQSCYIQSTGHFNAVEFNICFNQLAYVLYAHCFANRFFQEHRPEWGDRLSRFTPESFDQNQLSSMLIVKLSSNFKKEIRSPQFHGELEIGKIRATGDCVFTTNHVSFYDANGGFAEGDVTLAFVARR
jgi:hypothetical protein